MTEQVKSNRSPTPREARWARPKVAREYVPCGSTKLFQLIKDGRIRTKKVDGMRLIDLDSIDNL